MSAESPQVLALKQRYKASFPEKRALIQELQIVIKDGGELSEVNAELHKLAGSSGMYGYGEIASVCRNAMAEIERNDTEKLSASLATLLDLLDYQG